MSFAIADRVKQTSTTTGTGTLDLIAAATGFKGFVASIGDGNKTLYAIVHQSDDEWEVGWGTVTDAATDTLSRDVIEASSTGSAVSFSAGTKDVFVDAAAALLLRILVNGATTTTAAGNTTLVLSSKNIQVFTGTTTQNVIFPDTPLSRKK